jgi:hypothetical protein
VKTNFGFALDFMRWKLDDAFMNKANKADKVAKRRAIKI